MTHKLGPLPVWVWLLIAAVALYYWYTHYGPGAQKKPQPPKQGKTTHGRRR